MRIHPFVLVAALCVCPRPAAAQDATRAAVARLVAGLDVQPALRRGLEAGMAAALGEDDLETSAQPGLFSVMGCDDTEMAVRLVDLNGDDTPEVHVEAFGICVGGMPGVHNWMFIRSPSTGAWEANLTFGGGLIPLRSRARGFADVLVSGPGYCAGVWRWTGDAYGHLCNTGEGGASCQTPCPASQPIRPAGDELPAFSAAGSRR